MKKLFISFLVGCLFLCQYACQNAQADGEMYTKFIENKRAETNQYFKSNKSPLSEEGKSNFEGLPYYDLDLHYLIDAKVEQIENPDTIKLNTNTGEIRDYLRFAKLHFSINDTLCSLVVYKSVHASDIHYFLPFKDYSNGYGSYGAGRYLDLNEPGRDSYALDFNLSYNPYCAYSEQYSCPIPPNENHLKVAIFAGVKYEAEH